MSRKSSIFIIFFILFIILFDALQQKYYIDTFDLVPTGSIPLFGLLVSHVIRWTVWALFCIPISMYAWQEFSKYQLSIPARTWRNIGFLFVLNLIFCFITISYISLVLNGSEMNSTTASETLVFMTFQKGLSFVFSGSLLVMLLYNRSRTKVIDAQWIEIDSLKSVSTTEHSTSTPSLTIKIGNKLKVIALSDITWIEADDYCVKIHTEEKAYSLRKSMRSLEKDLEEYSFIRVHRGALLNMNYLDHVDFSSSSIKLQDRSEIPLSRSGAKELRKLLKEE